MKTLVIADHALRAVFALIALGVFVWLIPLAVTPEVITACITAGAYGIRSGAVVLKALANV